MSPHAADKVETCRLSGDMCKKCKAVISQAKTRLDNSIRAIVKPFDV